MVVAARGLRFGAGVRCRAFDDGMVVHVPATCETHVLPLAWSAALFAVEGAPVLCETEEGGDSAEQGKALTALDWQTLLDLKILDAIT